MPDKDMGNAEETKILELVQAAREENRTYHEEHRTRIDQLDKALRGDYERPGVVSRIARIEASLRSARSCGIVVMGAAITSVLGAISAWFTKFGGH